MTKEKLSERSPHGKAISKSVLYLLCIGVALLTAALLTFVFWRVNLAYAVRAKLSAIRASGMPTTGAELNLYYPAVPDNDNAALLMARAFALMRNYPNNRSNETVNLKRLTPGLHLAAEQRAALSVYVRMNADALARMRAALKMPKSRYPVDYTPGPNTSLLHLPKLHDLAEIVRYKSVLAAESGDTTNAAVAIENLLQLARTLDEEPDVIAQLVRIALITSAENSLAHCLNVTRLNDSELIRLSAGFSSADRTNLMARALAGDCADHIWIFTRLDSAANNTREFVEGAQQIGGLSTPNVDFWLIRAPWFFQATGFWDRDFLFYLNAMETNIRLDRSGPPRSLAARANFQQEDKQAERNHFYLSKMLLGALPKALTVEARGAAQARLSVAAIAVERFRLAHGHLPINLEQLTPEFVSTVPMDPFNGHPLHYRRLARGYLISCGGVDCRRGQKPDDIGSAGVATNTVTFTVEQ